MNKLLNKIYGQLDFIYQDGAIIRNRTELRKVVNFYLEHDLKIMSGVSDSQMKKIENFVKKQGMFYFDSTQPV